MDKSDAQYEEILEDIIISWHYELMDIKRNSQQIVDFIKTLGPADMERMRLGFPEHVRAYERFSREDGWWSGVQRRRNL